MVKINDKDYELRNNKYYEFSIDTWDVEENDFSMFNEYSSPEFLFEDFVCKFIIEPVFNKYVKIDLYISSSCKNSNKYVKIVFSIRNSNDFSCYEAKTIQSLKDINREDNHISIKEFIEMENLYKNIGPSNKSLVENNEVTFGVFIQIYEDVKELNEPPQQYVNELKEIIDKDDIKNNINNFEIEKEDYFEFRIREFKDFMEDNEEKENVFELCNYEWKITIVPYDFNIHLNLLNKNDKIILKIMYIFRNEEEQIEYKILNLSLYYSHNGLDDGYYYSNMNKKDILNLIFPLMKNNDIILGVYIHEYLNNMKDLIKDYGDLFKIKNEFYYEFYIDDCNENFNNTSYFKIEDYE
eukprot:jgi/Orpsp1_1/1190097/evm.model.d7180000076563.1